jgi:hypothetical protein
LLAEPQFLDHRLAHDFCTLPVTVIEKASKFDVARHLVVRDLAPAEAQNFGIDCPGLELDQAQSSSPYFGSGTPTNCTA